MSDLIRRQDVLKICDKYNGQGWVWSMIRKEVEELPCDGCCTAHSGYEAGMNREETIRRQDVLDLAKKGVLISNGSYASVCKAINEIPSAEPKTGHWIDTGSGQECSECHEIQYGYDSFRFYCAKCGSKNVEESENKE